MKVRQQNNETKSFGEKMIEMENVSYLSHCTLNSVDPDVKKGGPYWVVGQSINQSSFFTNGTFSSVMPVLPKGRVKHHRSFFADYSFLSFNLKSPIVWEV